MNTPSFPQPSRLTGREAFRRGADPAGIDILEFWRWSGSDLLTNTNRGVLAEFLVGVALGAVGGVRREWTAYDLLTDDGIKVEVKSSAYVQSWWQDELSTIRFDIRPARGWDPATNLLADEPARHAEVYVFCLFATEDRDAADPLDLSQWTFFVLPTATLDTQVSEQATIGLNPLRALGAVEVPFDGIRNAVSRAAMEGRG